MEGGREGERSSPLPYGILPTSTPKVSDVVAMN